MLTVHALPPSMSLVAVPTVQTGPVYQCPVCGQPALGLVPWPVNPTRPCRLDDFADHIWYLHRTCGCRTQGRVARLGDCITPLEFVYDHRLPFEQRVEANVRALQVALARMAGIMPVPAGG